MTDRFVSPGTPLTEYQRELLIILMEECAEVSQRAAKALRFGLDEKQEGNPFDNAQRMAHEIGDITCMIGKLREAGMISQSDINVGCAHKHEQLETYLQYAETEPQRGAA